MKDIQVFTALDTVTYTSTTRTAVSGYAESISLYKDADCFEDMGLSGAVVSVSVGKADTTKAENLIAAIEDLRDHNDDWYFILTDVTDPACVTALCKWAESTEPTEAALGAGVEDPFEEFPQYGLPHRSRSHHRQQQRRRSCPVR